MPFHPNPHPTIHPTTHPITRSVIMSVAVIMLAGVVYLFLPVYGFIAETNAALRKPWAWTEVPAANTCHSLPIDAKWASTADQACALMLEHQAQIHAPSLSAAVAVDGELVWSAAVGWSDLAAMTPATPETLYRIGSTSKAVTGTLLARLVDAGLVTLDEPIGNYDDTLPNPDWNALTLRQLASHTADQAAPDRARFYQLDGNRAQPWRSVDLSNKLPGGGFMSRPQDLVRLGSAWLDPAFISPQTRERFWTPQRLTNGEINEQGYTLTWRWNSASKYAHHGGKVELIPTPTTRSLKVEQFLSECGDCCSRMPADAQTNAPEIMTSAIALWWTPHIKRRIRHGAGQSPLLRQPISGTQCCCCKRTAGAQLRFIQYVKHPCADIGPGPCLCDGHCSIGLPSVGKHARHQQLPAVVIQPQSISGFFATTKRVIGRTRRVGRYLATTGNVALNVSSLGVHPGSQFPTTTFQQSFFQCDTKQIFRFCPIDRHRRCPRHGKRKTARHAHMNRSSAKHG